MPNTGNAIEQTNQDNLRAIFGNITTIEPNNSQPLQRDETLKIVIPSASNPNDSFGMTNEQFMQRQTSQSSDIDGPPTIQVHAEKPKTPTKKPSNPLLRSPSQKGNSKFIDFFRRSGSNAHLNDITETTLGPPPEVHSHRLSVGSRAAKLFSKIRKHSPEPESLPTSGSTTAPDTPRIASLPPTSPTSPSSAKVSLKLQPLNLDRQAREQVDNNLHSNGVSSKHQTFDR